MATFSQWRAAADKGEIRRVTWLCGDQRVLVEEIVTAIRTALKVSPVDHVVLSAKDAPARDIWAAANQYPLEPGANRLVVIRDAEAVTRWEPLTAWLDNARLLPGVHLVFVSNESDVPRVGAQGRRKGSALRPHVEAIQAKRRVGQVVRCTLPNEADAIAWVRRRSRLDVEMASHLLTRAGGKLATVATVCDMIALFDGSPGPGTLDALCEPAAPDSLVDRLLAGDKPAALRALAVLEPAEYGATISLLASRIDLMASLFKHTRAGQSPRDITHLPVFLVHQYHPWAKDYPPARCAYVRQVLAVVDDAYRTGARTGLVEALIALW